MSFFLHQMPTNDIIEHETDDCPCGAQPEYVILDDGREALRTIHMILDPRDNPTNYLPSDFWDEVDEYPELEDQFLGPKRYEWETRVC